MALHLETSNLVFDPITIRNGNGSSSSMTVEELHKYLDTLSRIDPDTAKRVSACSVEHPCFDTFHCPRCSGDFAAFQIQNLNHITSGKSKFIKDKVKASQIIVLHFTISKRITDPIERCGMLEGAIQNLVSRSGFKESTLAYIFIPDVAGSLYVYESPLHYHYHGIIIMHSCCDRDLYKNNLWKVMHGLLGNYIAWDTNKEMWNDWFQPMNPWLVYKNSDDTFLWDGSFEIFECQFKDDHKKGVGTKAFTSYFDRSEEDLTEITSLRNAGLLRSYYGGCFESSFTDYKEAYSSKLL